MALVILDPNLEGETGHHLAYDLAIAREALARGEAATIVASRRFAPATIEGVRIVPHFSTSTYARLHDDPVTGGMDDWRAFNDRLQAELAALPRSEFGPGDAVLVPTTTENHLAGYIGWMKGFDPLEAPLFLIHLMFPSGLAVDAAGQAVVEEPLRALFYRLAERVAQEEGPPVHLFASGGEHAREFSALFGRPIPPHPLPIRPEPGPAPEVPPRRALLFAGDARLDKGLALLPGLVPRLALAHPDWTLVAHVNGQAAWGEARTALEALAGLAATVPALEFAGGRLAPEDYLALTRSVGIALFPYDPALYRRKSSGVLWEAISLGTPVVVPADTWLESEARHWGAGHVAYAPHGVDAIAEAFAAALPRIGDLAAQSAEAAARYRVANGAAALMDQIAALWVPHKAAASLVERPRSLVVDLARLEGGWHRPETIEGRTMRWTMQDPVIAFDWPFEEAWELDIALAAFFGGAEQLERATVQAEGMPVSLSWRREPRGARLILSGPGPGRARPRIVLKMRLPHTHRPHNDARDLGILVAGMMVRPAGSAALEEGDAALPALRIGAPAMEGGGWLLAPSIAGELTAVPDRAVMLAFRLRCAEAPPAIRLHLGAVQARLRVSPEAEGEWLGTMLIPPTLLRSEGDCAAWTLVAEDGPAVRLLSAEVQALAGTTRPARPGESLALPPAPRARPAGPALQPADGPRLRWDLCEGVGPEEGPFPDLGVPAGVRWVVAPQAQLVVETDAPGPARLTLRYRCLLPRQKVRLTPEGGTPREMAIEGAGLREAREVALDLELRAGMNRLGLDFAGGVKEPGTGRELVLLVEQAVFG